MTAERTAAASSGARNGLQAHLSPPNVAATAAKVAQAVSGGASNSRNAISSSTKVAAATAAKAAPAVRGGASNS